MRRRAVYRAAGWALCLVLAGCGTSEPPPPCPLVLLVQGAEQIAAYRQATVPTPDDLRYLALLADLSSTCRYEDDGVELDLTFNLIAERGPALADGAVRLAYFLAAVTPGGQVIDKQGFTAELAFPAGRQRTGVAQELVLRYPIGPATGPDHRFYLGFQLDPAELRERSRHPLSRSRRRRHRFATSFAGIFRGSLRHRLTWGRLPVVSRPIARRAPRESSRRRSLERRCDAEGATAPETLRHPDRGGMALWRAGVALRGAPPKG